MTKTNPNSIHSCFKQARAEPAKKKAKKPRVESPRVTEDERSDDDLYYSTSARRQAEEDKENKRAKKPRVRGSFKLYFAFKSHINLDHQYFRMTLIIIIKNQEHVF